MRNKEKKIYLLVTATTLLFVLILNNVKTQTYIPITNHHNGISINIQGTQGNDYVFDRYYFDPLINDCGLCYIKSDIDIELTHNQNNSKIYKGDSPIVGGDDGEIRYRVDQDWRTGLYWAGDDGPYANATILYPQYTAPLSFDDMEYEPGVPVVGTIGFKPDIPISNKDENYGRGMLDQVGNEYHYFTYADDDDDDPRWKNLEFSASDGKSMLFCVNPKTPAIWLTVAVSGAQYYTTPGKVYWVPKFHEQISYVEDDVDINLKNIMNGNTVYYRIDGGSYTTYAGAISSNTLSDGEHILEFYYDPSYVQTRKIVKNPDHPSKQDVLEDGSGHGYLLWRDDADFLRTKDRLLNGYWASGYANYKSTNLTNLSYQGNGGIRNADDGDHTLMYAIVGIMEGVSNNLDYMNAAKIRLLSTRRMHIENIGHEVTLAADPNPCHELTYRGYTDDWELWRNTFTYDLLAKYYLSDQYSGGITPIEDLRIRDMLAQPIHEGLMSMGGYTLKADLYIDPTPGDGMWTTAHQMAGVATAIAMPSYNTKYYGTSGFDGTQAIHAWTPYPDYPESWKDVYLSYCDKDNPTHVDRLHAFPNRRALFNWYDGTTDIGLIRANGDWHDRVGYSSSSMMGHGIEFFYNVMKRKFGKTYPKLDLFMIKSVTHTLEGNKFSKDTDYGLHGYTRQCMANEYFPSIAPQAVNYDPYSAFPGYPKSLQFFFHNPDWASVTLCSSTAPPTVPTNFAGDPGETTIQLTWTPSTHTECIVAGYIIKRDGNIIAEFGRELGTQYIDYDLTRGIQYEYTIAAVSEGGVVSDYCSPIQVTTLLDNTPPQIANLADTDVSTLIIAEFNEELESTAANTSSNYSVNNGIAINSVQLQADAKTVYIYVSSMTINTEYTLTLNNIADIFGNVIPANTSAIFTCVQGSDNFALNRPVVVDSQNGVGYPGENAVDGDNISASSRWVSEGSSYPHWIEVDLLQTVNVDQVKYWVGYDGGYSYPIYSYQIQAWNGSGWEDILNINNNSNTAVDHTFAPVSTNKIRLYCTSGQDNYVRLYELEVYGEIQTGGPVAVTGVGLAQTSVSLKTGQTSALIANVAPSNATDRSVTWATSDTSVATIDVSGVITAVSEGNATITVTTNDGSYTDNCSVTITQAIGGINVALGKPVVADSQYSEDYPASNAVDGNNTDSDSRWLSSAGGAYPYWLEVDLLDMYDITEVNFWNGYTGWDRPVEDYQIQYWDGSNWSDIVNVTGNTDAVVSHAFSAVTTNKVRLYVTAVNGDVVRLYELEVIGTPFSTTVPVTSVSVSPASLILEKGQTSGLTETISPADATDPSVTWSTSDATVATVDANGLVTAVSVGYANITATTNDGGFTASCSVFVPNNSPSIAPVSDMTVDDDAGQQIINLSGINDGDDYTQIIDVNVLSSDESIVNNVSVNYTSGNSTGILIFDPAAAGTATITVTVTDDGGTANGGDDTESITFDVTVNATQQTPTNIALGKPVTADSEYSASYPASNAVDGNNTDGSSRWLTNPGAPYPYWLEVDLQGMCDITGVNFWNGYSGWDRPVKNYQVQYWNGSDWVDIVNVSGNLDAVVSHTFPSVTTDKVRLYITLVDGNIVRLYEIEVIGTATNNLKAVGMKQEKYGLNISPTINLFPNPVANNAINLEIDGFPENTKLLLQMIDMSGRLIYVNKVDVNSDNQLFTCLVPKIKKGAYILTISGDRVHIYKKFFVK